MSSERKSIFDLGEIFGIESPFGDWEVPQIQSDYQGGYVKKTPRPIPHLPGSIPLRQLEDKKELCSSMISMKVFREPESGVPGSAMINIKMEYSVITDGEGKVIKHSIISPTAFSKLYSLGDFPGEKNAKNLRLAKLPSAELEALPLSEEQIKNAEKVEPESGWPLFWEYYEVKVTYEFSLVKTEGFSFWDGLKRILKCISSKGLVLLLPFRAAAENYNYAKNHLTKREVKRSLSKERKKSISKEELDELYAGRISKATLELIKTMIEYVLLGLIRDKGSDVRNKMILIKEGDFYLRSFKDILMRPALKNYLNVIDAEIVLPEDITEEMKSIYELKGLDAAYTLCGRITYFAIRYIDEFEKTNDSGEDPKIGGVGSNEKNYDELNAIILNPKLFGRIAMISSFEYGGISPDELLVHEAGHNAAWKFRHKTGTHEYYQTGLQSNSHRKIYPSRQNTLDIINDTTNRKNISIVHEKP